MAYTTPHLNVGDGVHTCQQVGQLRRRHGGHAEGPLDASGTQRTLNTGAIGVHVGTPPGSTSGTVESKPVARPDDPQQARLLGGDAATHAGSDRHEPSLAAPRRTPPRHGVRVTDDTQPRLNARPDWPGQLVPGKFTDKETQT